MTLVHKEGVLQTRPIRIKRGIFQDNSLSPLLFTVSFNPLSQELQKTGYRYQLDEQTNINHLFYVDGVKLYGTSDNQITGLINTVKNVLDDIKMEFGLDKCAKASFKKGKKVSAERIQLNDNQVIQALDQAETYKYLGMEEGEGVLHHKMKIKINKEYKEGFKKMVRDIWKEKAMHGKFLNYLDKDHVDVELSFEWMMHSGLKGETDGFITAAQDHALNTRYYSKHIIKQGSTDRCRMFHTQPETVEHIISGCQTLAADQYLNRHRQVAAQLHLDICRNYGIKVEAEWWYQYKPG